uniref:uncharacterized protein si:ch211-130h14.4 n=1 Tax=Scatophagus argus TaxID=75038 RepID=UPI001ED82D65|nr:uncharacterized protein si:ch211-130h14.4 [Scatophagus argus]
MPVFSKGFFSSGFAMRSKRKDLHQSRVLPSISDANSQPVAVRKASDEVKFEPWRRKAFQDSSPELDQETKARRQAQLEQRHLEAYRNIHRLQDALHRRYAALLRDKVHSQRLLLQQRDEAARAKSQSEPKKKQKKLAISKLQHNDSYLKSLPKTSYYLKQLAQQGLLKTHHELEDFYTCIKYGHPSQVQKCLENVRKRMLESRSAADLMTQHQISEKHSCTTEARGQEDHISYSRSSEQRSGSVEGSAEIFCSSQKKNEFEGMFPKMKAPTFATLQPNFMKNFQSKMPDLIVPEIPEKSSKAEIYLRRLRQMHDLCLINMAFTQRLLDRETDSMCWQEERDSHDLLLPAIDSKEGKTVLRMTNLHVPSS